MNKCENCVGEGLVGQGPEPWLKQGHIQTCPVCEGTGIKPEAMAADAAESTETAPAENTSSDPAPTPVDNAPANLSEGSSDGSGADGVDQVGTPE